MVSYDVQPYYYAETARKDGQSGTARPSETFLNLPANLHSTKWPRTPADGAYSGTSPISYFARGPPPPPFFFFFFFFLTRYLILL